MAQLEDDLGLLKEGQENSKSIFARAGALIGSGFNEGLANILGLPIDAVNAGMKLIGVNVSEEPLAGSRSIKRGMDFLGIGTASTIQPENLIESIIQRTVEEVGAQTVPTGAALGLTRAGIGATSQFLRPFVTSPGTATAVETALAGGGGAGAGIAQQIAPESSMAEMGGQIGGSLGVGGIIGGTGAAIRTGQRFVAPFSQGAVKQRVGRSFEEATGRSAEEIITSIEAGVAKMEKAIGVKPTTAQAAGDVGLITAERAASRKSPMVRQQLEEQIIGGKRAVKQVLEGLPPAIGDPGIVADILDKKITRITSVLDNKLQATQAEVRTAIANATDVNAPELNRFVRQRLIDAESLAEKEASQLFKDIDPNIQVSIKRLKETAKKILATQKKAEHAEDMPEALHTINKLGPKAKETESGFREFGETPKGQIPVLQIETIDELMAFRSRLTDDIRTEAVQLAPNRRRIARLEELKGAVDDTILNDVIAPEDVAGMYERARQTFRKEVVERFRHGTVARVLQSGKLGEISTVPESATIGQFFSKNRGALEAAQDFKRALSNDTTAQQAVSDAAVNDFAGFSLNADGSLNISKAQQWIKTRSMALSEFPDVRQRVSAILKAGRRAEDLATKVDFTKQRLEKSAARFFLNTEPDTAVRRIMASPKATADMREAVLLTRSDTDALNGLRTAVWREGLKQAEVGTFDEEIASFFLSPQKLRRFFTQNRQRFLTSGLYSSNELNNVNNIIAAAETLNKSVVPGLTTVGSDTAANLQAIQKITGLTLPGLLSRFYAISRGVVSPRFIISEILLRGRQRLVNSLTEGQVNALLEEALIKPEVAVDLLRRVGGSAISQDIGKRLHGHLINLGPVFLDSLKTKEALAQEKLGQDETQNTIRELLKSPDISLEDKINASLGRNALP